MRPRSGSIVGSHAGVVGSVAVDGVGSRPSLLVWVAPRLFRGGEGELLRVLAEIVVSVGGAPKVDFDAANDKKGHDDADVVPTGKLRGCPFQAPPPPKKQ